MRIKLMGKKERKVFGLKMATEKKTANKAF